VYFFFFFALGTGLSKIVGLTHVSNPCHGSGPKSLTSKGGGPGSVSRRSTGYLWLTEALIQNFILVLSPSPVIIFPLVRHTHLHARNSPTAGTNM
jgi:hypothetical protein